MMLFPCQLPKQAIYVECCPKANLFGYKISNSKENVLQKLIDNAKKLFLTKNEPEVEWTNIGERPIAHVLFTWNEMPNLTNFDDKTKLTYIFSTFDTELASDDRLKCFTQNVDIIWRVGDGHFQMGHVDLTKAVIACELLFKSDKKHISDYN